MIKPLKHDLLFITRNISKLPKLSLHDKRNSEFLLMVKALDSISFIKKKGPFKHQNYDLKYLSAKFYQFLA